MCTAMAGSSDPVRWTTQASETQIRRYFRDYLGCAQLILVHPMDGEGTGHIDMFATFTATDTVVVGQFNSHIDAVNARIPMGRHADPEEIAALFAFLASSEAKYITGTAIAIDGGESLGPYSPMKT